MVWQQRAQQLLPVRHPQQKVSTSFGLGTVGLISEHTHYFPGFALVIPLPVGVGVALREHSAPEMDVRWATNGVVYTLDEVPDWHRCILQRLSETLNSGVEGGIYGPLGRRYSEGFIGALAAAWMQAMIRFRKPSQSLTGDQLSQVASIISECIDRPFGEAPVIASLATMREGILAIDVQSKEYVPMTYETERLGWALIDTKIFHDPGARFFWDRKAMVEEAISILQRKGFKELRSLRQLAHEQLSYALELLPRRLVPIVRHLVTENRRVQRMIMAIRKHDWQMVGGLMLISQASLKRDWRTTIPEIDFLVNKLQQEGIYGVRMVGPGFGGQVLVLGQLYRLAQVMDEIKEIYQKTFGTIPETALF